MDIDRYAVLGNPIAHSQSPRIHRHFAQLCGQAIAYEAILVATDDNPQDGFTAVLQDLQQRSYRGCNVTVPFKAAAFAAATHTSARAQLARACNTLCFTPEGIYADNTDGAGLLADIQNNLRFTLVQKNILLLGAGGAAAGVLGPLLQAGAKQVMLANRSLAKAQALCMHHAQLAQTQGVTLNAVPLSALSRYNLKVNTAFDLLINATASSLSGASLDLSEALLTPEALVYDMMYGQAAQPFLQWGAEQGAQTSDGLGMLVEQAAESFYLWRSIRPSSQTVLNALRNRQ